MNLILILLNQRLSELSADLLAKTDIQNIETETTT